MTLKPHCQGAGAKRWKAAAAAAGGHVPAAMVIPDCVDETVGQLLYAMDDANLLHIWFTTPRAETVDMSVVGWGEPLGWYMGDAWRYWYSKERLADTEERAVSAAESAAMWGVDPAPEPPLVLEELPMPRRAIEELG